MLLLFFLKKIINGRELTVSIIARAITPKASKNLEENRMFVASACLRRAERVVTNLGEVTVTHRSFCDITQGRSPLSRSLSLLVADVVG